MQITDPRSIPQSDLPLFVFSDNTTDLISFLITWRTRGAWNHAMLALNEGKFVWQGWTYQEGKMETYMKKGSRLEFFTLVNMSPEVRILLTSYVVNKIKLPWYKKLYDWIGIFGQAIGLPKIHTPGLEYCSVDVTLALKTVAPALSPAEQYIINAIPDQINPQDLHDYFMKYPAIFRQYGEYEADEGVIA